MSVKDLKDDLSSFAKSILFYDTEVKERKDDTFEGNDILDVYLLNRKVSKNEDRVYGLLRIRVFECGAENGRQNGQAYYFKADFAGITDREENIYTSALLNRFSDKINFYTIARRMP